MVSLSLSLSLSLFLSMYISSMYMLYMPIYKCTHSSVYMSTDIYQVLQV
jgi:hypothetical protein